MSIKNNIKYQDGGDPIKGKKPKKRIILAETPTAIDKSYNLVPIDSKKYPLGTFSADIMREGRNKLLDEIVSLEKRLGIEQEGRDDGSDLLDDIFGATNNSMSISEITKIVKDNYGVDISKEDGIIDAYKRATGYPGVIKYGFDKYDLKETITETKDDTFLQEAKKAARLSKENGVPAEVVPIYGKEQFEQFKARYNKEALNGADIVILGHSSDKKMFGVPNKELNDFLRDNMDSSNICYGGTCTGPKVAASMPDVPNMYVNMGEPWIGVPDYKSYAGRDFNETFFGNTEVFNGQDEWATAKPIRAKYGVDYTNYRKDPVTILSETPEVVNIPRPQQNIQPLPTIQSGVSRMQNGGDMKNNKYQSGGAANYLEQILGAVNQGNPFTPKNEKASLLGYDTWLKDNGYTSFWDKANKQKEYADYVASNKSFNEQIPLGPNFGGLFELNQMATDEQLNKKDTLADYTKSISTYAPQGFAEEGGMVDRQAANKFPSLQAILAGLPKEMKAKDKQKVAANAELELQQILGYKDNSPYKDLPSIDIYSDTIDMNNVSTPLEATSNNGISKILQPNSGLHYFAGADVVREVPMAQDGGGTKFSYSARSDAEKMARGFHEQSLNSPEYIERLKMNTSSANADRILNRRKKLFYDVKNVYGEVPFGSGSAVVAQYIPNSNIVNFRKQVVNDPSFNVHEYSHATTGADALLLRREKDIINRNTINYRDSKDAFTNEKEYGNWYGDTEVEYRRYHKYLTQPTEVKARLDVIKQFGAKNGIVRPGEYIDESKLKKIIDLLEKEGKSYKNQYEQLNSVLRKDSKGNSNKTLIELWNKIASVDDNQEVFMAKEGGTPEGSDGDVKKSWREGKKLAVYMGGTWHHFGDSSMQDFRQHKSEERKDAWYARHASALKGDDPRSRAFRLYAKKTWNDGGQPMLDEYMQGGGPNRQMIFNLFKQKPMSKYENGGFSHRAPSYQFNLPVGNKTKVSGFIPLESLIPIQTEKKELIVLPTFDVVPVNAKQRHSQMTDDQVTDIVPENSYILSQFGQVDIYRSEADEVIIETENKPYNLYGVNPEPRVKTLGDIMSKKVMKPADLGRALTTKYKQIDNAGDPYTEQTNMANKETLSKYLQALIGLSEMDKARKGIDNSMEAQMSQGQLPQMVAANGGTVMRSSNVPKASLGLFAAAGASLLTGAFNYFSNRSAQKKADQNQAASLAEIAKWRNQQLGLSNTGLGIGMASVFAQDPTVDPVLQQSGFLDAMQKGLPQQFLDYQQSRNLANRPDFSGLGAQESNALNTQYYSQTLNSQSALALQAARDRAAMFNKYLEAKGQIQNFNIASRTNATNATRVNANNMISTAGGIGMGNITDRQNIETNALQSKLAANNNALQFSLNRMGAENQGYLNSLALGTQVYNSITANQPAVNQNNVQPRSTDQYQDPYGFNGTQGYGMSNYTSNPYDFTANAAPTGAGPLYSQNNPSDCILGRNIRTGLPC